MGVDFNDKPVLRGMVLSGPKIALAKADAVKIDRLTIGTTNCQIFGVKIGAAIMFDPAGVLTNIVRDADMTLFAKRQHADRIAGSVLFHEPSLGQRV